MTLVLGMLLQRQLDRWRSRDDRRHDRFAAVLTSFRRTMAEAGKALQAHAYKEANPQANIDVAAFVRSTLDAADLFGEDLDRAALTAPKAARKASTGLVAAIAKVRTYPPLAATPTDQPIPDLPELLNDLEALTGAARATYEDAISADLGTSRRLDRVTQWATYSRHRTATWCRAVIERLGLGRQRNGGQ